MGRCQNRLRVEDRDRVRRASNARHKFATAPGGPNSISSVVPPVPREERDGTLIDSGWAMV